MSEIFSASFSAPHQSLRASAGSGKTYQLTGRYLRLLQTGAPPESILATTFTRKAAGEILTRVLERLTAAAMSEEGRRDLCEALTELAPNQQRPVVLSQSEVLDLITRLCRQLHRLSVTTLDGLFSSIARSFALELGLPPRPMMADPSHPVAATLRAAAIGALLSEDTIHSLLILLRRLHHDSSRRSVSAAMDRIVGNMFSVFREAPRREQWECFKPVGMLSDRDLAQAKADYRAVSDLPAHKSWVKDYHTCMVHMDADNWQEFLARGPVKAYAQGQENFRGITIPPSLQDVLERLVRHAIATQKKQILEQHLANWDFLQRYAEHDQRLRRERGLVFFDDLTHKLARELPSLEDGDTLLTEIYFRLDTRFQHLLLDEFQDTSVDQWQILAPIAQEIAAHADHTHSLLCVGDTKQAIYGWRGGCAELFEEIENQLHLTAGSLTRSYRSSPVVLSVVNTVFDGICACPALQGAMEAAERFEAGYETHLAAREDLSGYVTMIPSPVMEEEPDEYEDPTDRDPQEDAVFLPATSRCHESWVAEQVSAIHAQAPQATIGLLVSTNDAAAKLMFHLRRSGVVVSGEGGGPLTDTAGVLLILSALQLSIHPADTAAACHLATSPLAEPLGFASPPGQIPPAGENARISRRLRQGLLERGLAEEVGQWVTWLTDACPASERDRLGQLVDLAEAFELEAGERTDVADFLRYVQVQRVESPQPARVRVMTIHQAKGLEFDAVVLPQLDRRFQDSTHLLVERATPTGPIERVWPTGRQAMRALDPAWERVYARHVQERRYGDLCALYVALTRARHALYLFPRPRQLNAAGAKLKALPSSFAAILRHQLAPHTLEELDPPGAIFSAGTPDWYRQLSSAPKPADALSAAASPPVPQRTAPRLQFARHMRSRLWAGTSPSRLAEGDAVTPADLLNLDRQNTENRGTLRGDLIHGFFEEVGWAEDPLPELDALLALPLVALSPLSIEERTTSAEAFLELLQHTTVQEALCRQGADVLWRERAFAVHLPADAPVGAGRLLKGRFDRVHLWQDVEGRFIRARLIDFKSDRCSGPQDVTRLAAIYLPQITAYRVALSRMLQLPLEVVEAGLLFTQLPLYHALFPPTA